MFFFVTVRFMIPKHPPTSAKFQPFLSPFFWVVEGQQSTNFTPNWRIQVKKQHFFYIIPTFFARFLKHQFLSDRNMFVWKKLVSQESLSFGVTCTKPERQNSSKTSHYEKVFGSTKETNSTFCGRWHFTKKTPHQVPKVEKGPKVESLVKVFFCHPSEK